VEGTLCRLHLQEKMTNSTDVRFEYLVMVSINSGILECDTM
jgi:hypothetical protein